MGKVWSRGEIAAINQEFYTKKRKLLYNTMWRIYMIQAMLSMSEIARLGNGAVSVNGIVISTILQKK